MGAHARMQNARPIEPFENGSPNDYALLMANFDMVANTRGMDTRAKVLELQNWFKGAANKIVKSAAMIGDPDIAYATARSKLDDLFGRQNDNIDNLIKSIKQGKAIHSMDHDTHVDTFAELCSFEATATAAGIRQELDRTEVLRPILEIRLPHMEEKFWEKNEKRKSKRRPLLNFQDLLDRVQQRIGTLKSMGRDQKRTAANHGAKTTPEQCQFQPEVTQELEEHPTERCNFCEGPHATLECGNMAHYEPDMRVKKMMERGICMNCGHKNHRARECPSTVAKCLVCFRNHPSFLHGRSYPQPAPRPSANDSEETSANVELIQ